MWSIISSVVSRDIGLGALGGWLLRLACELSILGRALRTITRGVGVGRRYAHVEYILGIFLLSFGK